jgi:hypothetical protein
MLTTQAARRTSRQSLSRSGRRSITSTPRRKEEGSMSDPVNHPSHYVSHPSGVECIQITEHMGFNLGNAIKYVWRADLKADAIEDLRKAIWYIDREIQKRERP